VLAALTVVQDQNGGWLSPELMDAVAEYLGMPRVSVYEVAVSTRCLTSVRRAAQGVGVQQYFLSAECAEDILTHIEKKYGVQPGQTTRMDVSRSRRKRSVWPPAAVRR